MGYIKKSRKKEKESNKKLGQMLLLSMWERTKYFWLLEKHFSMVDLPILLEQEKSSFWVRFAHSLSE